MAATPPRTVVIERADLQRLLDALQAAGLVTMTSAASSAA